MSLRSLHLLFQKIKKYYQMHNRHKQKLLHKSDYDQIINSLTAEQSVLSDHFRRIEFQF
jgi:hypothetical protein